MCGRARLIASDDAIALEFQVEIDFGPLRRRFNIAPAQPIPILREPGRLELLRWGFLHASPSDRRGGPGGINVRAESRGSPIYRQSFAERRCLVVVDGFYEWRRPAEGDARGSVKQPYLAARDDGRPFALAGIWDETVTADGVVIPAVGVVTVPAAGAIAALHDRMPLILDRDARARWLDGRDRPASELVEKARFELTLVPVSRWVNDARHDDERCNAPPEDAPAEFDSKAKPARARAKTRAAATGSAPALFDEATLRGAARERGKGPTNDS
jgi:putative SOS response-associated peptidase YedK